MMTLVEATQELRKLAGGKYCTIKVECNITRSGEVTVTYVWYVDGHNFSESYPAFPPLLANASHVLNNRRDPSEVGKDCEIAPFQHCRACNDDDCDNGEVTRTPGVEAEISGYGPLPGETRS